MKHHHGECKVSYLKVNSLLFFLLLKVFRSIFLALILGVASHGLGISMKDLTNSSPTHMAISLSVYTAFSFFLYLGIRLSFKKKTIVCILIIGFFLNHLFIILRDFSLLPVSKLKVDYYFTELLWLAGFGYVGYLTLRELLVPPGTIAMAEKEAKNHCRVNTLMQSNSGKILQWSSLLVPIIGFVLGLVYATKTKLKYQRAAIACFAPSFAGGVILPMIIFAVIVAGTCGDRRYDSRDSPRTVAQHHIKTVETALAMFYIDHGFYPTSEEGLQVLVTKPATGRISQNWVQCLRAVPKDPWGNEYEYRSPGTDGRDYEIISLGQDGKLGGEERDADINSWDLKY